MSSANVGDDTPEQKQEYAKGLGHVARKGLRRIVEEQTGRSRISGRTPHEAEDRSGLLHAERSLRPQLIVITASEADDRDQPPIRGQAIVADRRRGTPTTDRRRRIRQRRCPQRAARRSISAERRKRAAARCAGHEDDGSSRLGERADGQRYRASSGGHDGNRQESREREQSDRISTRRPMRSDKRPRQGTP